MTKKQSYTDEFKRGAVALVMGLLQKNYGNQISTFCSPFLIENHLNIEQTIHKGRSLPC